MNIVQTYFEAMADKGISKGRAIDLVNKACGKSYNHSRMAEFKHGVRVPPADVVRFMAHKSVRWVMNLAPGKWSEKQMADALTAEPLMPLSVVGCR